MSALHDYAFVCVFVAHAADGEVHTRELMEIRHHVSNAALALGHSEALADELVTDTMRHYLHVLRADGATHVLAKFRKSVDHMYEAFRGQEPVLDQILKDLLSIARADGVVRDMEVYLLDEVADAWRHVAAP